jgi:Ca-activated chloride channel family protein
MIRLTSVLLAVACLAPQKPSFRADVELVRIDVLVEEGGRPVGALSADDFVVLDDGVPQRIRVLTGRDAVTVTTLVDVSGSMTPERLDDAAHALDLLIGGLRPGDRHTAFAFANSVRRLSTGHVEITTRQMGEITERHTSLFDALQVAILDTGVGGGPTLLVVATDGRNNISWVDGSTVIDEAVRHETVVYPVSIGDAPDGLKLLAILAAETGGRVVRGTSRGLGKAFREILAEYRQRYILSFTPEGLSTDQGWHRLEVRVPGHERAKIRARRGYWVPPT